MRFKGTTVLLIVFVALSAYVYFTEYRGKEARQQQEEAKKKAFQVEQKDITEISLVSPGGTIAGLKKAEKQWQFTSPSGVEADPDEWDMLASNIPKIERAETVSENAQDLTPFGLKEPALKVSAKTAGGKTIEISFGSENPKKTFNYAKLADNNVFLTPSSSARLFTKTVSDLRNKRVLELETESIDAVKIAEGSKTIELQKSGDHWELKKPIDAKADDGEITTFLNSIRFARASSFPEPPVDAKNAGLDQPGIRITLHDGKAKADRVLLIGKTAQADKYYARDASRDPIFIIEKEISDKARRAIFDWRDKSIAAIDRNKVEEVEIQRGEGKSSFKKDGADWKLADGRKLQWEKVSGMLNSLEFNKAKDIIDAPKALSSYGLDKPRLDVVIRQGSNEAVRILFGSDSKNPEGIYLKTSGSPLVKVAGQEVFDNFNVKTEDLVEVPPPAAPPAGK